MKTKITKTLKTGLSLFLILLTTFAFAQKSTKESVFFQYLSLPQHNLSAAKNYSVIMNGEQITTLDAILKQCSNEELKNFSIPNQDLISKGALEAYFKLLNIPKVAKNGELSITLTQGETKLLSKKEAINKVSQKVNGERVITEYKYYAFTFNQPCRLRINYKGKTIFNDNIGNTKRTEKFGYDSKFTTTAPLEKAYKGVEKKFLRAIRISATAYDMFATRMKLENLGFVVESRRKVNIYSGKGRKLDYSDLDKAQTEAKKALETLNYKQITKIESKELDAAEKIWESYAAQADFENKKAKVNKKVAEGVYNNLITSALYRNNPSRAMDYYQKAIALGFKMKDMDVSDIQIKQRKERIELLKGDSFQIDENSYFKRENSASNMNYFNYEKVMAVSWKYLKYWVRKNPATDASQNKTAVNDKSQNNDGTQKNTSSSKVTDDKTSTIPVTKAKSITEALAHASTVTSVWADKQNLTTLPSSIETLTKVKTMMLRNNNLESLPKEIGRMFNLEVLNLFNNPKLTSIPKEIAQLQKLEELSLSMTGITDLPSEIESMKSLKLLDLSGTSISYKRILELTDALPNCKIKFTPVKELDGAKAPALNMTQLSGKLSKPASVKYDVVLHDMQFFDDKNGVASGSFETIATTNDGGKTWNVIHQNSIAVYSARKRSPYKSIHFFDQKTGWVIDGLGVNYTEDGGKTFVQKFKATSLKDVHFYDKTNGVIAGGDKVYFTKDGGETWKVCHMESYAFYQGVHMTSPTDVVITANLINKPAVFKINTNEKVTSGRVYYKKDENSHCRAYKLEFINNKTGFVIGRAGYLIKSSDGGKTWSKRMLGSSTIHNLDLIDIAFKDDQVGWITAWDIVKKINIIYVTTDGGETWTRQISTKYKNEKIQSLTAYRNILWLAGTKVFMRKD
jgi:photosystem II stability/assembly factor-like uncharacterized protein